MAIRNHVYGSGTPYAFLDYQIVVALGLGMEESALGLPPDPLWRSVGGLIRDLYSPPGALSYFEFSVVRAADISDFHRRFGERPRSLLINCGMS